MSIYFNRCITISKFVMGINIYIEPYSMQDSFTRELIIQPKIILEKITQVDFDITLLIEDCERIQYTCIIDIIGLVNIIKEEYINHLERDFYIPSEEHIMNHIPNINKYARTSCCSQGPPSSFINELISSEGFRSSHLRAYNLEKVIIKFDIVIGIMNTLGHFAQRGHQSPTVIKLNITVEYHVIDFSSISGPNYLSITSVINLDIIVKVERFIRVIYLPYVHQFNIFDIIEAEQFAEHLLDYICINGPNYISVTRAININIMVKADRFIRTICPSFIYLHFNQNIDIKTEEFITTIRVEPCLPHHGNINCINYVFMASGFSIDIIVKEEKFIRIIFTSSINLLYDLDIDIKAERFIRTFCSSYIYLVKNINREAPSGDHQQTLKSHCGASSMNTSEEHIICVQDFMVKQKGLDIQTSCIYLTIFSVFASKCFMISESIIDNYFHIILVAVHQWEALDITHSCPSGNGVSKSHHIEWRNIFTNIIDSNPFMHNLIKWNEVNHHIIKNNYIIDIIHQESICIIYNLYIKAVQGYIVINDIKKAQSSYSLTQSISLIDTIIYDTNIYHTSIYDILGIIIVEGIDLSSITKEYNIIGFINFMKHPSEDIVIILNHHILKKKELNIKVDASTIHLCEFITTTFNINPTQQFSSILQNDNNIIDYIIQANINNTYLPSIHFSDISGQNINMVGIRDYFISTEPAISLQIQDPIYNQIITLLVQQQLNIIHHSTSISLSCYRVDFHIDHLINHFESYITFYLLIYLTFDITFYISYINQFIIEPYSTIIETGVIKNVDTDKTSYIDIKILELYITTGDTDISVYLIISIVELINSIMRTRTIIVTGDREDIKIIKEEFGGVIIPYGSFIKSIVLLYVSIVTS